MPAPPSEPVAASKPEPAGDRIESLSDLSTTDRQALPPLKLSMHLWNADPARRFVILDGNRVGEAWKIDVHADLIVAMVKNCTRVAAARLSLPCMSSTPGKRDRLAERVGSLVCHWRLSSPSASGLLNRRWAS